MKGSEKQIVWAEQIKAGMAEDFAELRKHVINDVGTKALDYIQNNECSSFWIDHRNHSARNMLKSLLTGHLQPFGFGFDRTAKIAPETGIITETWTAIVSDGNGGHREKRTLSI